MKKNFVATINQQNRMRVLIDNYIIHNTLLNYLCFKLVLNLPLTSYRSFAFQVTKMSQQILKERTRMESEEFSKGFALVSYRYKQAVNLHL